MINRLHSVAPLCPYSLCVCTCLCTRWKSRGIHYSILLCGWPSAAPHKSTDVRLHCFTLSASPSLLRQQARMSLSAGRSWAIQAGTPSPSTPPRGPWGHPQASRAGSAWASRGVEQRGAMSGGERLMKEQKLSPWFEHMVSPVILEPVGHLWMEPLVKAAFVTVCNPVRLWLFLLFGRAWLLSMLWDSRMSREQLVNSEQTAALQETLSTSSQPHSSAPTNTQRILGSVSRPLPFLCCLCVPWLASWFGFSKQNK